MLHNRIDLFLLPLLLLLSSIIAAPLNTYYLIDIDHRASWNTSYCSNILFDDHSYRIPRPCQKHLQCHSYHCDDQSFRCVKIRETLCCLHRYFHRHCSNTHRHQTKDQFRSLYFHISIEHGYCEINLERIEKFDPTYCLSYENAFHEPVTRNTSSRSSTLSTPTFRTRHRLASRTNHSSLIHSPILLHTIVSKSSSMTSIPLLFILPVLFQSVSIILH